jgi:DNA-binding transcriptional ArsR family regulator
MVGAETATIHVEGSIALELFWVLHDLALDEIRGEHPVFKDQPLRDRAKGFWPMEGLEDCPALFEEILILADVDDSFAATDPGVMDSFLQRLPEIAQQRYAEPQLASEEAVNKAAILRHLATLRDDASVRANYQGLLRDVWAEVRETWETIGRRAVEAAVERLRSRARRDARLADLVHSRHWVLKHPFRPLAEQALDEDRLLLSPCYFGGHSLIFDLPDVFVVGIAAEPLPRAQQLRQQTEWSARQLKVMGDGTRMAILAYLAETPASVTELANEFSLAQPTVSAHLRLLREARMVTPVSTNGRTRYEVATEEVETMLSKVRHAILGTE